MANKLVEEYEITIFTIYAKGELEKELSSKIKLKSLCDISYSELSKLKKIIMPFKVLLCKKWIYKKLIKENYDTEIAFLEGPITRLFSCKNEETKKIVWIHNDISFVFGDGVKAKLKRRIDEKIYSKYEKLVFVSKENLENFSKTYPNVKVKKQVIYNYIDKEKILEKAEKEQDIVFDKEEINFVTVARLVKQKGIDRLIDVHKKLIEDGFEHHFYIIGEGPERESLERKIKEYKLQETFSLLGKKENPYPYIKNADYFCLLSKFEGYGMVIEEAKILNKPIIITDTAAREAVQDYGQAKIVENTNEGIYNGIKSAINNKKESLEKAIKYNNDNIIDQVKKII